MPGERQQPACEDVDVTGKKLPSILQCLVGGWTDLPSMELKFRMGLWDQYQCTKVRNLFGFFTALVWGFILAGDPFTGKPIIRWTKLDGDTLTSSWHWLIIAVAMTALLTAFYKTPSLLTFVAFGTFRHSGVNPTQAAGCLRWNFGYQPAVGSPALCRGTSLFNQLRK